MINRFAIEERVREWGLGEHVVEKDFALGWLLWAIGADPVLGEAWVFKGGTCLKKCYVETWRFSEDLDFTVRPGCAIEPDDLLALLRPVLMRARDASGIDFLAQEPRIRRRAEGGAAEGIVYYRGPRQAPMVSALRLDLSRIERIVLEPEPRRIDHQYPDALPEPGTVSCYAFVEVFAEKIRAMGQRGLPRDLYDIVNLFRRGEIRELGPRVREVLATKCANKGIAVPTMASIEAATTRTELESEWENMLGHQLPALPPLEAFWRELPALFAWLEGLMAGEALVPIALGATEVPGWSAPRSVSTWGFRVPLESIRFAAANRLCVDLSYHGSRRIIEPYSLRRTAAGDLLLHAVRADNREHRAYRVDQIEGARITEQSFVPVHTVEISAWGPLSVRDAHAPGSRRPTSISPGSARFEVECPVCRRVFSRTRRNATLKPHKNEFGTACPGRRGVLRAHPPGE